MNITTEPIRNKKQLHAILGYLKENSSSRRKARLRNFVIAKTQLNTSLRISDVLPLKVSDIMHLSGNFRRYINLKEDKTGHKQRIAINDPLKETLRMYIKEMGLEYDDFLFPGQTPNKPVTTTQIHRVFQDTALAPHIDNFNTHSLRKTWGYYAYKETKNIALIMEVYGHTTVRQTMKYIGITQSDKDRLYNTIEF